MQALGFIETRGLLAAIESADAMLKAAEVKLLEKTYVGGGLVTITVTGGVAAVKAAVEAGCAAVRQISEALLVSQHVIARPHEEINDLIVPVKKLEKEEILDIESVGVETLEEVGVMATVAALEDDKATVESTVANAFEEEIETIAFDEINKESIDKLVLEYGLEKALQVLSKLKVTKLRSLAREYVNLSIKGRTISRANKDMILAEFKEYYKNIY